MSNDDWIVTALRDDAAEEHGIDDDGFSRRVVTALPPSVQRERHRWIVVTMAILGCVIGLGITSGGEDLTLVLASLTQWHALSVENLLLAAIPLGLMYWIALGAAWQET